MTLCKRLLPFCYLTAITCIGNLYACANDINIKINEEVKEIQILCNQMPTNNTGDIIPTLNRALIQGNFNTSQTRHDLSDILGQLNGFLTQKVDMKNLRTVFQKACSDLKELASIAQEYQKKLDDIDKICARVSSLFVEQKKRYDEQMAEKESKVQELHVSLAGLTEENKELTIQMAEKESKIQELLECLKNLEEKNNKLKSLLHTAPVPLVGS